MVKRSLLKSLLMFTMVILIATDPRVVNADCAPTASHLYDETTGCPSLNKTGHWLVTWSGAPSSKELTPTGSGQCTTQTGCCGASPSIVECWPLFNPPTISGTMVSIVVTNRRASSSLIVCGESECALTRVTCASLGTTTFSVNQTCSSGGGCEFDLEFDGGGSSVCECYPDSPDCVSPILIDVAGNGFQLSSANDGVDFDIRAIGAAQRISWTTLSSDDAWLALDRNGNGVIDDGSELFGNFAPQPDPPVGEQRNGFLALAEYDKPTHGGNGDGLITPSDTIFSSLRLWQDLNHNGISEAAELISLQTVGLKVMELDYKEAKKEDEHGNYFRYWAKVKDGQNEQIGRWAWDVFLVTQ